MSTEIPLRRVDASRGVSAGTIRLESVDLLRGLVMILMALDHARDFFGDLAANPTDLRTASTALFATRWITHFCAPVFFLLSGTGARLALARRTPVELSRFLLTRGLWLVVAEVTVLRFAWQFNVDYHVTLLTTIWAIGWSMVVLALLVRLPLRTTLSVGLGMIAFHNAFDGLQPASLGPLAPFLTLLHQPGMLLATPSAVVFLGYPLIPWVGVMAVGYALGVVYEWAPERRRAFLLRAGIACVVAFVLLRAVNVYGDPRPWQPQATGVRTLLAFLNTNKYPPSLLYLLMTLGPALLVLRAVDGRTPGALRPALTYGRVPFFYYAMHVVVLHLFAVGTSLARFGTAVPMVSSPTLDKFPVTQPAGWPVSLPWVYLAWIAAVVLLYPVCRWFGGVKRRHAEWWWLGYL